MNAMNRADSGSRHTADSVAGLAAWSSTSVDATIWNGRKETRNRIVDTAMPSTADWKRELHQSQRRRREERRQEGGRPQR